MEGPMTNFSEQPLAARFLDILSLLAALVAGAVVFLPFAFDTSPLDAVMLRVPGDQGNWWHALIGVPFFLAFPLVWLCARTLFAGRALTSGELRFVWTCSALSGAGTVAVEVPFLLHLAGTSEWQRFIVVGAGLGILATSATLLILGRRRIPAVRAGFASLAAAFQAVNIALT